METDKNKRSKKEEKTAFVVVISAITMLAEIIFGLYSNSMALLADGIHMGSHVLAIGLSWGAYVLVRHLQHRNNINTDSEKILSLSAYTNGILLLVFALYIVVEAIKRFFTPMVEIRYLEAMAVAVIGMVVNLVCAVILHDKQEHDYNSHSAYLHIIADALTSLGAIFGLVCAMIWDIVWIDTLVAFTCSLVIIRWAKKLLMDTGKFLTKKESDS